MGSLIKKSLLSTLSNDNSIEKVYNPIINDPTIGGSHYKNIVLDWWAYGRRENHGLPTFEGQIALQCFPGRRLVLGFPSLPGYGRNQNDGYGQYLLSTKQLYPLFRL